VPTPARDLYDATVRQRIALERYSTAQTRKALTFLRDLEKDLVGQLAAMRAGPSTRTQRLRLASQERLLASVRALAGETYTKLRSELTEGMTETAGREAKAAAARLASAGGSAGLNVATQELTATAAFEIAQARPLRGAPLKDWLDDLGPQQRKRIEQALRISFAEGESLENAMKRLRGATALNERGLETLIRTANTHIASTVTEASYEANADIIQGVEWVSVLDSRTTSICQARDGKRWPVGEGPRPPAHPGCRSTTIPVLLGVERQPRETYGEWLARQGAEEQDDILGPARGRLFREGKLKVDRFVDLRGKPLTLDELGATRAGVELADNAAGLVRQAAAGEITAEAASKALLKHVETTRVVRASGLSERLSRLRVGQTELWVPPEIDLTQGELKVLDDLLNSKDATTRTIAAETRRIIKFEAASPDEAYWAEEFGYDLKTTAAAANGDVEIYAGGRIVRGDLAHEMGHNYGEKVFGGGTIPDDHPFAILRAEGIEPPPTAYARENVDEDWAETVRLFVNDPELLERKAPRRLAIVRKALGL
jgi:SPP1 gp7 family putative phage head morphogenesis protein